MNPKVRRVLDNVRLRREVMKKLDLVQKTKRRVREKAGMVWTQVQIDY